MALRIGGGQKPPIPQDENMNLHASDEGDAAAAEMQEPAAEEASETPEEESAEGQGGSLDQSVAGYKGPEQGPFKCANCIHYGVSGPGTCEIVSGQIDEEGLCNVFTSNSGGSQEMPMQMDMEELPQNEEPPAQEEPEQPTY